MGTTTTTYALNKPTVGGDENAWGADLNANADKLDDLLDGTTGITPNLLTGWEVGGVAVTSTAAELNILDGVTATTAEINILDGVTASTAEINLLDGVTASTAELNILDGVTATASELNVLDGITGMASQAQAEAGTDNATLMTPLRVAQAIDAQVTTLTVASQAAAEAGTNNTDVMTPLRTRQAFNAAGTAPVYACRAWVQFDGMPSSPTIIASGNVASVTKGGTGRYTITYTTAMPNANYAVQVSSKDANSGANGGPSQSVFGIAAGSCEVRLGRGADNTLEDSDLVCVCIFG